MLDHLRNSLSELGLSKKEAEVYLAMLELGPSSAQEIAQKADINRSTTYIIIEALQKRGLASTFEKGKKICYVAENPQRLVSFVVQELSGVEAKRQRIESFLPHLLAIFNAREDKPTVRFFEGEEALSAARREIADSHDPIWEVYAVDEPLVHLANIRGQERIEGTKRARQRGRALMAIKPGVLPPYFDLRRHDARVMDYDRYPFSGDLLITGNKLYILTSQPLSGMGIVVESDEITAVLRALFEAAWQSAKPWVPPSEWSEQQVVEK